MTNPQQQQQQQQPPPTEGFAQLSPARSPDRTAGEEAISTRCRELVTPELIARARASNCAARLLQYAEVINPEYTVKLGPGVSHYEFRVLQFLERLPNVPTPRPINFFDVQVSEEGKGNNPGDRGGTWHVMVISTMPGKNLGQAGWHLKLNQVVEILKNVMHIMDRINMAIDHGAEFPDPDGNWHQLDRKVCSVSDLDGDRGRTVQLPFYTDFLDGSVRLVDFVSTMSRHAQQPPETVGLLSTTLEYLGPKDHDDIRFCHMDLHSGNIMVDNGCLSGIIDWELAGWYTRRLAILGGMKELLGPNETYPYIEAWNVPSDLEEAITEFIPLLDVGHDQWKEEQMRLMPNPFKNWRRQRHQAKSDTESSILVSTGPNLSRVDQSKLSVRLAIDRFPT